MTFTTSTYGIGSHENFIDVMGGFARGILGRNGKFNFNLSYKPINSKVDLVDCSWGNLMQLANNVPHLNMIIGRGAEMYSGMEIKQYQGKGKSRKEIDNSEALEFLRQPNALQRQSSWLFDFYVQNAIYKTTFCYKNIPSKLSTVPSALWWLPGEAMKINLTGKMFDQVSIEGIIESYELLGYDKKYLPNEVIHIIDGVSQNKITATPTIVAQQLNLSNIVAILKSYNIITTEKGMIGFIGGDAKDSTGMGIQMTEKERTQFENAYQSRYGLDSKNGHVMITQAPLKWVPMTFPVKDLMLFEGAEDAFAGLCGAFGHDRDIYPSVKGATYENKNQGLINTYQNAMMPLGKKMLEPISDIFQLHKKGQYLEPSWEHLPIMQEDEEKKANALNTNVQAYSKMHSDGIIGPEQYAELAGVKMDGTGEPVTVTMNRENNSIKANDQKQQTNGRA